MRKAFAIAALICGILGLLAGVNEWFLQQYVLWHVDWEGPLQTLSDLSWFMETVFTGLAIIFLAIAFLQDRQPAPNFEPEHRFSTPPPMILSSPVNPPPIDPQSKTTELDFSVPSIKPEPESPPYHEPANHEHLTKQ